MIISGKEALDLDLKKSESKREYEDRSSAYYNASDIPKDGNIKICFYGGLDGIVSWLQHNWWMKDLYGKNPNGDVVTRNVVFASLKDSWTAPDESDPGFLMGSKGEQRWASVVLIDMGGGNIEERVFTFTKSVWDGIVAVYRSIQSDFGDDADIGDYWLRISNSGEGPNRYGVQFTGIPYKPAKGFTPKYAVRDFIRMHTFNEVVLMMREAGLPIDEKLVERGLDEYGNKLPETEKAAE